MVEPHKITEDEARAAREVPLPDHGDDPDRATQLLHRRDRQAVAQRRSGRRRATSPSTSARRVGAVQRGVPRRPADLHDLRPGPAVHGGNSRSRRRCRRTTVHGRARRHRQQRRRGACHVHRQGLRASRSSTRSTLNGRPDRLVVQGDHARGRARRAATRPNDRVSGGSLHVKRPGTTTGTSRRLQRRHDDAHRRRSRSPTTARSAAPSCRSGPGHYGDDGAQRVIDMAGRLGIDTSQASAPCLSTHARHQHVQRARHGPGVLGVRQRRHPSHPARSSEDRRPRRQGDLPGRHRRSARAPRAGRPHRDPDAHQRLQERHRRRALASTGPPRARPAPPTTTATPGSSATRRSSRRRCGWATRSAATTTMNNVGGIRVYGRHLPGARSGRRS